MTVDGVVVGAIGAGLLALVGIAEGDTADELNAMARKALNLRVFDDSDGRMNLSVLETGGAVLAVSQFTLFADCRKGRRPNYLGAAPPDVARELFGRFVEMLRAGGAPVETGVFQAHMRVALVNDGPVTIALDSRVPAGGAA